MLYAPRSPPFQEAEGGSALAIADWGFRSADCMRKIATLVFRTDGRAPSMSERPLRSLSKRGWLMTNDVP
jgi:hypothetical protein